MSRVSRRLFLVRGSLGVAAAGVAAAIPGIGGLASSAPEGAPEVDGAAGDLATSTAGPDGAVAAHIRDLATGEISIYSGDSQVIYRDPALAARLVQASQSGLRSGG